MKYAFSTISWTSFTWKEAIAMAKDLGFSGIEVRGLENNVYAVDARPFSSQQVLKTAEQLANLHLEVSCFSTTCNLNDIANQKENIRQLKAYIDLAAKMGTSYVRLLPDDSITLNNKSSDDAVISIISEILPYAEKKHVILLLETIGIYCDTDRLRKVLEHFASDNLAALWDIHHPYRFNNESPEKTVQNLGAYIKYVHLMDSVMINGQLKYRLMVE